jgi:beta-lactamase superfamily II metal-dependent hydrolase
VISDEKCNVIYTSRTAETIMSENENYPYTIDFLYPYQYDVENALNGGTEDTDDNDFSSVAYFDYQGVSALFAADIRFEIEDGLMLDNEFGAFETRAFDLTSTEILKVAHHGSKNATSAEWLKYLHAKTAVISCGEGNPYGHPADELLSRLYQNEVDVWRTDTDGNVIITISSAGEYRVTNVK